MPANEKRSLLKLFQKIEDLFEGKVGTWNWAPVSLELKEGAKLWHGKVHTPPLACAAQTQKECDCLCAAGTLQKINDSKWGHPTFITPKKDGKMRWTANLRGLNKQNKHKPHPLPNVHDLLLKLEGFNHASAIDLNMGHCHVLLDKEAHEMCTTIMPWGKC